MKFIKKTLQTLVLAAFAATAACSGGGSSSPEPVAPSCPSEARFNPHASCYTSSKHKKLIIEWDYATKDKPSKEVEDLIIAKLQPRVHPEISFVYHKLPDTPLTAKDKFTMNDIHELERQFRNYTMDGGSDDDIHAYLISLPGEFDAPVSLWGQAFGPGRIVLYLQDHFHDFQKNTDPHIQEDWKKLEAYAVVHEAGHALLGLVSQDRPDHVGGNHDRNPIGIDPVHGLTKYCFMTSITPGNDEFCEPCKDAIRDNGGL